MPYTDAHGRPEILVHPDIRCGHTSWRPEPDVAVDQDDGVDRLQTGLLTGSRGQDASIPSK